MSNNNHTKEDEQFRRVFNGQCDITEECLDIINNVNNNYPNTTDLRINSDEDILTNLAWRLLGGYIANNTHLIRIILEGPDLTDANMVTLFESYVSSSTLKVLGLFSSNIHIDGVRKMLPLLLNFQLMTTMI